MSGPDGSGGQAAQQAQSAQDAQFESARNTQFESTRNTQWQSRPPGQDQNVGGYPPALGQPGNPYQPSAGTGSADAGSTGGGQSFGGQTGAGQFGPGPYGAANYNPAQYNPGQYNPGQYNPGQFGTDQNPSTGGYQPGGYGGDRSAAGPVPAADPGSIYPPPPAWGQGNPVVPDQFRAGYFPPGTQPDQQRQRRTPARTLNPEKALGVAVAVLGGLNFVFGFLPQYTGGSTTGNFSVYAVGPGYVPILLLIAGLLALAAFVPGSERSRLAVAAVSVGGAVAAVISIGTTSPGTASLGTGLGAILLTVFGIVQAVIAIGGYVVGAGISPRSPGSAKTGQPGPGAAGPGSAISTPAAPFDPGVGSAWAGTQGTVGWASQPPGAVPSWQGQPPLPADEQRSSAPADGWQAAGQRSDQAQWRAGQSHAVQATADQSYGSPASAGQPNAAETYGSPSSAQPMTGEIYGSPGYARPNAGKSYSSPTYADQSHTGSSYFGQPSSGQYPLDEPARSRPRHSDPAEPATGPQSVVGADSARWSATAAAHNEAGQPPRQSSGSAPEQAQQDAESQSDVVDLVEPTQPPPNAR